MRRALRKQITMVMALILPSLSLLTLAVEQKAHTAEPLLPLTIAYQPIIPYLAPVVAEEKGYFKEVGLRVEKKVIFSSDVIRSGIESGEVDIGSSSTDSLIRAYVGGFDHKLVYPAVFYDPKSPDVYLVVRSDLPVSSAKDLEGKIVAATFGSIAEAGVKAWLRANGADISRVRFVEVRFTDMPGALETKRIDAAHIVEPFLTTVLERGVGRILGADLDIVGGRFLVACYIAKEAWLRKNPEKAKRFVRALETATKFIIDNPKEALPILAQMTRVDPKLAAKFFPSRFVADTKIRASELQSAIDFSARERFIEKSFEYTKIISTYAPIAP